MNNTVFLYSLVFLAAVFLSAVSQVLLKLSARKKHPNVILEYLNPYVIFGYGLFFVTTLLNVLAYRGIPLNLGPVLDATGYLYVTAFGVLIFKEKLTAGRIIALVLIVAGILVFALG